MYLWSTQTCVCTGRSKSARKVNCHVNLCRIDMAEFKLIILVQLYGVAENEMLASNELSYASVSMATQMSPSLRSFSGVSAGRL